MTTRLVPGTVYAITGASRDIGYGQEDIGGQYVWTGETDTWGKLTLRSIDGEPTLYLFPDEIHEAERVWFF